MTKRYSFRRPKKEKISLYCVWPKDVNGNNVKISEMTLTERHALITASWPYKKRVRQRVKVSDADYVKAIQWKAEHPTSWMSSLRTEILVQIFIARRNAHID